MKKLNHLLYIGLTVALFGTGSCISNASEPQTGFGPPSDRSNISNNASEEIRENQKTITPNKKQIKYHYILDQKNDMVRARVPLPVNWEINPDPTAAIYITGPGIKVNKTESAQFVYSNDPFMLETQQQMGYQIAPLLPVDEIIRQHIQPQAAAQGYKLLTSYPLPAVVSFWEKFASGMPDTGSQRTYYAHGTEWENQQGERSFILVVQNVISKQNGILWTLYTTELEAPVSHFEKAKQAYLHGVANTEINPQWQQMMNGQLTHNLRKSDAFWRNATAASEAAHKQRMQAITACGNASRAVGNTYSDILDISHQGYLNRNNINNDGHSKTINMISEQTVIGNHDTGEHYTVDDGSKYYWVNNDGAYFGTDNPLYDPRIDNKINDTEWTQFTKEN